MVKNPSIREISKCGKQATVGGFSLGDGFSFRRLRSMFVREQMLRVSSRRTLAMLLLVEIRVTAP